MMRRVSAIALTAVLLVPGHALAWGYQGHQVVAAIAWGLMTPAAQARALALLAQDTDKLTAPDFVSRATWADTYRNSHSETSAWHYVDTPLAKGDSLEDAQAGEAAFCPHPTLPGQSAAIGAPADDCLVDKINQFEAELKNPATPVAEQIFALKFLMHFIGDVHQPLHAVDDNDKGGNCVWITDAGKPIRLHSYWDTGVVRALMKDSTPQAYGDYLRGQIDAKDKVAWQSGDAALWAAQSTVMAHDVVYKLGVATLPTCGTENTTAPITTPPGYDAVAEATARQQLEKAGVRLAYVLNQVLVK